MTSRQGGAPLPCTDQATRASLLVLCCLPDTDDTSVFFTAKKKKKKKGPGRNAEWPTASSRVDAVEQRKKKISIQTPRLYPTARYCHPNLKSVGPNENNAVNLWERLVVCLTQLPSKHRKPAILISTNPSLDPSSDGHHRLEETCLTA